MAILNSCLTGAETDHVQAFAADLVMAGVPITVGMQYPVALTAARAFSEAFLCRVAEGADVADILTDGREAARDSEELGVEPWDFATPVLFVSSALVGPGAVRLPKLAGASGDEPHDPDGVAVQDLPRPPDRFVGRRTELRDIGEALARRSLTVIYGAHGVGKTALAREAAGRAAKQFTRVAWVSGQVRQVDEELETIRTGGMLAGRPASETDVITRLADQLGSEGLAPELNLDHRLRECLRRASRGQPLIVLDNLDSVLEGPYARQLLKELPANCGVLVTCHRRPAGTYPTVQVLDLPVADASRLVCAQARSLSLSLSQSERGLLLSKVGGHPLAARLVLARAARSDKALHRILAELPEERGQLVCYVLGELERLEHPTAVRLLTTASVFVGAVPTSVLQQASGLPPRDFREAMGVLVDLGLVERTAKAVRVGQLVGGAILRRVDVTGLEQLCAGVSWVCRIADPAILLGTTARLVDMCESRGTTRRLVALAEEALDRVTRTQDTALLGIALEVLGAALWSTQEAHGALKQYAQAQSLYVACGDLRGQAVSAVNMATLHREVGVLDEALRCCENARRLAAQIGDADLMQAAMSCLGSTLSEKGDMDRAAGCYAEALRIAGELGDAKGQAIALQNTGNMHVHGGRLSEALTCYHDARTRMAELRDTVGEAHVMGLIAIVELTRGNLDEALDYALRAHRTAEQVGDAIGGAAALGTIGIVHTERGDLAEALECLTRALEMTQVLGHPVSTALLLGSLGNVHARSGDLEQALHCFAQAHDMAKTVGSLQTMANQLGNMATVHMRRGHFAEGLRCNMEAYELGQRIGNPYTVAICLGNSGIAHLQCSDADTARRDFTRALELFDSHGFAGVRRDTVARALHELDELQRFLDRQPADAET
jgi:tetratricopeptide (TPR) repeat protein